MLPAPPRPEDFCGGLVGKVGEGGGGEGGRTKSRPRERERSFAAAAAAVGSSAKCTFAFVVFKLSDIVVGRRSQ